MERLLESLWKCGPLLDCLGLIGLGFVGLSASRLAARYHSWGGTMMAWGAIALLLARFYIILRPIIMTRELYETIGPLPMEILAVLVPLLLSFGLAGIVWGLWGHEKWLRDAK